MTKQSLNELLTPESIEWKNGDEVALELEVIGAVVGDHPNRDHSVVVYHYEKKGFKIYNHWQLKKPESAEAKATREREQKANALYDLYYECHGYKTPEWEKTSEVTKNVYRRMIDRGVTLS
jgi:hypothetical protein